MGMIIPSGIWGSDRVNGIVSPSNTLVFPSQISFHKYYIFISLSSVRQTMSPIGGPNLTSLHKKINYRLRVSMVLMTVKE